MSCIKLTLEQVAELRAEREAGGASHRALAAYFGVAKSTVARALRVESARDRSEGEKHPKAKLTAATVTEARERHARGERLADLAREFGVTKGAMRCAVLRYTWKHVQ